MVFEEALKELDTIVRQLESGQLTLDAAIKNFERGKELVSFCTNELKAIEQRIDEKIKS